MNTPTIVFRRSNQENCTPDCTHFCNSDGRRPCTKLRMRGVCRGSTNGKSPSPLGHSRFHSRAGTGLLPGNHQCWRSKGPRRVADLYRSDKNHRPPCNTLPSSCTFCIGPYRSTTCALGRQHREDSRGRTEKSGNMNIEKALLTFEYMSV